MKNPVSRCELIFDTIFIRFYIERDEGKNTYTYTDL